MHPTRILALADQLEREISSQGLRPGDAYPRTEEIARRLGVSTSLANGALRILANRGILDRRPRRGTVVACLPGRASRSPLRRVHLLVHREYLQTEGLLADGLLIGIEAELPGVEMQFRFIPPIEGAEYADQLVSEALHSRDAEGFVLVRAPLAIQRALESSGLPAVVFGTLHPSIRSLPWIERDQAQIGALAAEHFLARRCRRMAVLLRAEMGPGDFPLLDSFQRAMAAAKLGLDTFALRCLHADRDAVKQCATALLQGGEGRIGFLCRSQPLAEGAVAAAESLGLAIGRDLEIVVSDIYRQAGQPRPTLPFIQPLVSSEQIGRQLGRMLAQKARGEPVVPDREIIPVTLAKPASGTQN